ncbi:LOW QUALITY PROTEIN: F-BAR domain only protein 1-like [Brienomyrus brachyistius]|uniref:LOW QUALITY PROTEIN: F-BAR domain only protein 1-like n=1 Tax=Brienomyrus brachyistius TaxID=42636 RepID=UPI0020B33649|nr:LOW QUALITY PROTEIN: F-BAR domain only protein 1-like [Brienomyrus brachyistius]
MAFFGNNFWGEKNAGFDVLYHNMKHGQLATKELAEFVRERAAIEETYSKSMSKLAKMASNGSPLGTFAPMWDVFRVSSDKLALCHLELMRKMNSLIVDINKYGDEQVKVHRKTKDEVVGTLEAVQMLQVQNAQLQKNKEAYSSRAAELERLRREGAPQKELEKAELKSKKAAESLSSCVEKYNRVGGDFEQKMMESAQKFQDIEEAHLRQMKLLIRAYSHSIEDTHVQVGQVHEEFKQNVENIAAENLIKRFAEQKGTGKDRPAPVGFEEFSCGPAPEGGKRIRSKAFRIPGLGKRDKEPDSTDTAVTDTLNSPEVDEEGFVIRADVAQNGCPQKDPSFYSSDSDFDDDEPKKFHIRIRPVGGGGGGGGGRPNPAADERELRATVGALTLAPNQPISVKRNYSKISTGLSGTRSEDEGDSAPMRSADGEQDGLRRSASSPDHGRLKSTASVSESLFGPPLESACLKPGRFADTAFSSDSSSPENVEDSGLDSPSHQPLGPSPEPTGWAAWPAAAQSREPAAFVRPPDPFLTAFRDPSPGRPPAVRDDPSTAWAHAPRCPRPESDPAFPGFPAFGCPLAPAELEAPVWSCKHIPPEDPFLAAFERTTSPEVPPPSEPWAPARPRLSREGRGDPFSVTLSNSKALTGSSSTSQKDRDWDRDRAVSILDSPEDPFAITMIGSPTHQSSLAAVTAAATQGTSSSSNRLAAGSASSSGSTSVSRPKKDSGHWNSLHNPFSEGPPVAAGSGGGGAGREITRKQRVSEAGPRRNGPPLTRHSGPQEDLCFSTDNDQDCLDLQVPGNSSSHSKADTSPHSRRNSADLLSPPPPLPSRSRRAHGGQQSGASERSRSLCSSPLPDPSPAITASSSSSSSSPSEWGGQPSTAPRAPSPARGGSRGPSPISLNAQETWPVAAALTEYINAFFKGGEHNRCLVKITGDLTMSFPAGITRIFAANPNTPVLSFRLVNVGRVDSFLPNQKLLYSDPSQSDPATRDFWFNMQALTLHLQKEAELNPQASYYNVAVLKYQVSSQDSGCAPLLLSAECQRSGTVTRISLDYHCCPATVPAAQLTGVQVLLQLDHTATDLQCQPPAAWNPEERRLLWKLANLCPTNHSKGSGTLCASWQCLEAPRGPPPCLMVQFVGTGASLAGLDVELVGSRYHMSLVKKRFTTGRYMAGCSM